MTDTYRLGVALTTLQRALAGEPDEWGEVFDPLDVTGTVEDLLDAVLRRVVGAEAMAEMAQQRIVAMQERKARFAKQADALRGAAFAAMDVLGIPKRELPDLTASVRQNAARVVITDEAMIPPTYFRIPAPQIDKAAVTAAIKAGQAVPGAELSNSLPSLSIRTK